jgi:hypothetical protein
MERGKWKAVMNKTELLIRAAHEEEREKIARVALHLAGNTDDAVVRAVALLLAEIIREDSRSEQDALTPVIDGCETYIN